MVSSKTEIKTANGKEQAGEKARKKRKLKKIYWLLIDLAVAVVIFVLILYRPGRYDPVKVRPEDRQEVSKYLTHVLWPQVHNGAQLGEPFDLVVSQEGINDVVARSGWPKFSGEASISAPAVLFVPDEIVLMGTVGIKGVEFVVTIVVRPELDEQGLLNLRVGKVKVGAMNITPVARMIGRKMYQERLAGAPVDRDDLRAKIVGSLLNDEPFEPVFGIKDVFDNETVFVRTEKIIIEEKELILRLIPVGD